MPRLLVFACIFLHPALWAREVQITVLATTDLHGNLLGHDYFTDRPAARGLASIATLIRDERKNHANTLLIDCGDTIQGTPLEALYQNRVLTGKLPPGVPDLPALDPMMTAMNALGYDAMAVGNHEYNFGLKNLSQARSAAHFPWLSANTRVSSTAGIQPFDGYVIRDVGGVRVAIVGVTTPAIPNWEKPENYRGLTFEPIVPAVSQAVAKLKNNRLADVIIVAAHSGLGRDLNTGADVPGDLEGENAVYDLAAAIPGVDAVIFGHTHSQLENGNVKGVLLVQPKNWGGSLAAVDLTIETEPRPHVVRKQGRLRPVQNVRPDPEIERIAAPYHTATGMYLNTKVTTTPSPISAAMCRVEDTAVMDAVHEVMLHYSHADVSLSPCFNPNLRLPAGPVTVRALAALYVYENELFVVEVNGRILRLALENAARYYQSCADPACTDGAAINPAVIGYNYDMAEGVQYDIDLTQPEGSRVKNLRFRGEPLEDDRKIRLALSNYRAGGSGGYTMFRDAKVVWRSYTGIRELMIEYFSGRGRLPPSANRNWRVVPAGAEERLRRQAQEQSGRPADK